MATTFTSALTRAKKRRKAPTPADPPLGSYDPQYDAIQRQNQRGYDDLTQDFSIGKTRGQDDLNISLGQLTKSQQQSLGDLTQSRDRNLADLLTGRSRNSEDYQTAIQGLDRRYASLGRVQGEHARQQHVESAGILAQSLAKRQQNRALDQQPLDTSYQRSLADSTTAERRLGEDYTQNVSRTNDSATQQSDALKLAFDRAFGQTGDNTIKVSRAGRDLVANNLDLTASRWFDATANGYTPPAPKKRKRPVVI